ncbi:MAG: sulfur carrier protein ThiS [Caulobacteraceae bacterium]
MITVNGKKMEFESGTTIAGAVRKAEESIDAMTLVILDGRVIPSTELNSTILCDGACIKLMRIISGG